MSAPARAFAVNPHNGDLQWQIPFRADYSIAIATPVWGADNLLFVSAEYNAGTKVIQLVREGLQTKATEVCRAPVDAGVQGDGESTAFVAPRMDAAGARGHTRVHPRPPGDDGRRSRVNLDCRQPRYESEPPADTGARCEIPGRAVTTGRRRFTAVSNHRRAEIDSRERSSGRVKLDHTAEIQGELRSVDRSREERQRTDLSTAAHKAIDHALEPGARFCKQTYPIAPDPDLRTAERFHALPGMANPKPGAPGELDVVVRKEGEVAVCAQPTKHVIGHPGAEARTRRMQVSARRLQTSLTQCGDLRAELEARRRRLCTRRFERGETHDGHEHRQHQQPSSEQGNAMDTRNHARTLPSLVHTQTLAPA